MIFIEPPYKFYVCPICGNSLHASGNAVISCCGVTLPPLEAEECDESHRITIEQAEDEQFITVNHDMTITHFISFLAWVTTDRIQLVKLYPEGNAQTRLSLRGMGKLYLYCNKHGLMYWKKRFLRFHKKALMGISIQITVVVIGFSHQGTRYSISLQ